MNLEFNDTLYYIALIIVGIPLVYFATNSEFEYQKDKKRILASIIIAPILILLITSAIFGVDETTKKIGRLFGDFLHFIVYTVIGLIFLAVCCGIFMFLISDNKKEMINDVKKIILKIGSKNK